MSRVPSRLMLEFRAKDAPDNICTLLYGLVGLG